MNPMIATLAGGENLTVIISAIFLGIGQLMTIYFSHRTGKAVNGRLAAWEASKEAEHQKLLKAVGAERFAAGKTEERSNPEKRREPEQRKRPHDE